MPTVYEVGAEFIVRDKASAVIAKIGKAVADLGGEVAEVQAKLAKLGSFSFTGLSSNVEKLNDIFATLGATADKTISGLTSATDSAAVSARNLAATWASVGRAATAASGAAARASVAGAPGGGRGGRGNGLGITAPTPSAGGFHFHAGGLAGQIGLGAIGYGTYQAAELSEAVAAIEMASGQQIDINSALAKRIRGAIKSGMTETGLSPMQLAGSAKNLFLQMGGVPINERLSVLPDVFRFAALEGILKHVSPDEATQSLVGLLHMSGAYNPADMKKLAASLAFASTISPVGLPGIEKAASYVLPISKNIMGLDPAMLLLVTAQMQSSGLINSKSGTWLQGALQALSPKGNFSNLLTGKGARERMAGLQRLGLVGQHGELTGLKMLEQNDWVDFIKTLNDHLKAIPQEKRMGALYSAMGSTQAARGLAMLTSPAFIQLLPELAREQKEFASHDPAEYLKELSNADAMLQFRRSWQDLNLVLLDIGVKALPPLITAFKNFDSVLNLSVGWFNKLATILSGAAVGYRFAGPVGAVVGGVGGAAIKGGIAPSMIPQDKDGLDKWKEQLHAHPFSFFGPGGLFGDWTSGDAKKNIKEGTKEGAKEGVENALRHKTAYWSNGSGGPILIPASYTTGGGLNDGVLYGGMSPSRLGAIGGGFGGGSILHNGVGSGGSGSVAAPMDATPVPGGVLAEAAKLAGNPGQLQKFMRDSGFPKSGAWCGEFASAVIRRAGGVPPSGSAVASNWRKYGTADSMPHVGDIAVADRGVRTGATGSHVGFVTKVNPDGSFVMEGGNQGGHMFMTRHGGYTFRAPPANVLAALTGAGGGNLGKAVAAASLSKSAFDKVFGGTPMGGMYNDVVAAAKKYGLNPALVAGVVAQETGAGTSHFLKAYNNPAGLMNPATHMMTGQRFSSLSDGIDAAARVIAKNYHRGGDSISGMAKLYAPPGAANDPHHLNGGWARGVHHFMDEMSGDDSSPALAGNGGTHVTIHHTTKLDGRTVAKNTLKHIGKMGNQPQHSSRLTDPFGTAMLSI